MGRQSKVLCKSCEDVSLVADLNAIDNPYLEGDMVFFCPLCGIPEDFTNLCERTGCDRPVHYHFDYEGERIGACLQHFIETGNASDNQLEMAEAVGLSTARDEWWKEDDNPVTGVIEKKEGKVIYGRFK